MKLADLRKLSIRRQVRIRFAIRNGMECVVNEHGIAQVPGLRSVPDFNLEQELVSATSFVLEPVTAEAAKPRQIPRDELASMISPDSPAAAEHEDE